MKNKYEVRGEVTAIFIESPKYGRLEALISTNKLERAKEFPNSWGIGRNNKVFYVIGNVRIFKGKSSRARKSIGLHRWITNAPNEMEVDHFNHNGLDNTDGNLRIVTKSANMQNKSCYNNSSTGVRGISWCEDKNKYRARLQVNKKRINIGFYDTLEKAENAIIVARSRYMPYSQEASA